MIAELPDPARRYFRFAIDPGTPLVTVAEIAMEGEIGLGNRAAPSYLPMRARQILAAPEGFVWKLGTRNRLRVSGSDAAESGRSWSRFWLLGILPVARAGGNDDHARSAFGRCVAEAVFFTPAVLLPGDNVRWQAIGESTARVTLAYEGLEQAVDLCVDARGRLEKIVFERWSDANPQKVFRRQPFGGCLSDYREFGGYRLPTRIEAGNMFGTDDYFPFMKATVTSVRFPGCGAPDR